MKGGLLSCGYKADPPFNSICCHWGGFSLKLSFPSYDLYMRQSQKYSRDTWHWYVQSFLNSYEILSRSFTGVSNRYSAFQLMQVFPKILRRSLFVVNWDEKKKNDYSILLKKKNYFTSKVDIDESYFFISLNEASLMVERLFSRFSPTYLLDVSLVRYK